MKASPERLTPSQQTLICEILGSLDCAVIYLFGSFGGPASRPDSDIDIAFLGSREVDAVESFNLANSLADHLGRSVDLIDLRRCSTVMAKEVIRTGTVLLNKPPSIQQDFEMRVLADYAKLNEERKAILAL